ncbi:MAG: hypothetical protein IJP30_04200 [Clostridia bacterium]|nr:hypothetical protein [Clostridia bacterium]
MKRMLGLCLACVMALCLFGCAGEAKPAPLPKPEAMQGDQFGVDKNINMTTIDQYLGRDDVAYRDMRMLFDPAQYGDIGGEADLTRTIRGFKVVPFPYIGTLQSLPVAGAYTGDKLFDIVWTASGEVESVTPVYEESMTILEELFPKDKAIFLMCGGGGYAGMMRTLLIELGWNEALLYNIGANWTYDGENKLELIVYPEAVDGNKLYAMWRADYAFIPFDKLNKR